MYWLVPRQAPYDVYYQYEASDEEENKVVESCFSAPWQEVRHTTYTYWQERILKDQAILKQLSEEIDKRVHGIEEPLNPVYQRTLRVPIEVCSTFVFPRVAVSSKNPAGSVASLLSIFLVQRYLAALDDNKTGDSMDES